VDVVFCGTPQFAVPTLSALVAAGHNVRLVVSQPDRPSGRGQQLSIPAVKQRALELKLPVTQPPSIKNNGLAPGWRLFMVLPGLNLLVAGWNSSASLRDTPLTSTLPSFRSVSAQTPPRL